MVQGSIVHSLKRVTVEADFQLLVSVYNPNMLDAEIDSGTAVLYHKHTEVCLHSSHKTLQDMCVRRGKKTLSVAPHTE